jgi:ABC-type proline/glycine betaine transport system permease subunit
MLTDHRTQLLAQQILLKERHVVIETVDGQFVQVYSFTSLAVVALSAAVLIAMCVGMMLYRNRRRKQPRPLHTQ